MHKLKGLVNRHQKSENMTDSKVLHCQLEDDATTVDYTGDGYKDCQTCGDLYKPTINPLGNDGEHRARPDCDPATDSPAVDMCDACDQRRIRTQTNGCFKMCPNGLCGYAVEMPLEKKVPAVCKFLVQCGRLSIAR